MEEADDEEAHRTAFRSWMTVVLSSDASTSRSPSGAILPPDKPLLTASLPGTGGSIKNSPEDFVVEEVPAFPFSGAGDHLIFQIEKRGIPTFAAIERISRALGVARDEIGYAGLKDAAAISRQFLSVAGVGEDAVRSISLPDGKVLSVSRHAHKLRAGMLSGNRFAITVRGCDHPENAAPITEVLSRRGIPNYFGEQRFGGGRNVSAIVGRALLLGDFAGAIGAYVSVEGAGEPEETRAARRLFSEGRLAEALDAFPSRASFERRIVSDMLSSRNPEWIFRSVFPRKLLRLFISAVQSDVFNRVLAGRINSLDRFIDGDIGMFSGGATFFRKAVPGDPRLASFEVSPSGPIVGYKAQLADGTAGEMELQALAAAGIQDLSVFRAKAAGPGLSFEGARRRLRARLVEPAVREGAESSIIILSFFLEKGAYATEVLREVTKAW